MAEQLPSSFRLQQVETADTVFSRLLIANMFKDSIFRPGVTFTNKYNERGGQIYVRRLGKPTVHVSDATAAGGMKFTHAQTADSLIMIPRKDRVHASEEVYEIVETLRSSGQSVDKVNETLEAWKEKLQMQYVGYLLQPPATAGQVEVGGSTLTTDSGGSAITTVAELVKSVLDAREQIRVNGGTANILLVSPQMETILLANALTPGNAFVPETNEEWLRTGRIGRLYGLQVFATNLIGSGTPLEIPVAGNALPNTGNAENCEYVIYDHNTFAIAADLFAPRLIPAIDFTGSLSQCDSIIGGGIANPALAYAKINAAVVAP